MKMTTTAICTLLMFVSSCAVTGEPVEFSKACHPANDGKTLLKLAFVTNNASNEASDGARWHTALAR